MLSMMTYALTRATSTATFTLPPFAQIPRRRREPLNEARGIRQREGRNTSVETTGNNADRGTVVGQNPQGQSLPGGTGLLTVSTETPPAPDARGGTTAWRTLLEGALGARRANRRRRAL
jgi:hypothetical protein